MPAEFIHPKGRAASQGRSHLSPFSDLLPLCFHLGSPVTAKGTCPDEYPAVLNMSARFLKLPLAVMHALAYNSLLGAVP